MRISGQTDMVTSACGMAFISCQEDERLRTSILSLGPQARRFKVSVEFAQKECAEIYALGIIEGRVGFFADMSLSGKLCRTRITLTASRAA